MNGLEKKAKNIRNRIIKEAYKHQVAHVGSCLSCVEILTVLFFEIMKPEDKFILSPGHKALALYATLVEKGVLKDIDLEKLGGHPKRNPAIGIEVSTGSLGHGLPIACGMALAGKKVYVLLSDGDLEEGSTWEAIKFAGDRELSLTAIIDANGWSAYKRVIDTPLASCLGLGWNIRIIGDGHSLGQLKEVLSRRMIKPVMILTNTIKGKGLPEIEDKLESHYMKVTKEMMERG